VEVAQKVAQEEVEVAAAAGLERAATAAGLERATAATAATDLERSAAVAAELERAAAANVLARRQSDRAQRRQQRVRALHRRCQSVAGDLERSVAAAAGLMPRTLTRDEARSIVRRLVIKVANLIARIARQLRRWSAT